MCKKLSDVIKELYKDENLDTENAIELKDIIRKNILHIKTDLK